MIIQLDIGTIATDHLPLDQDIQLMFINDIQGIFISERHRFTLLKQNLQQLLSQVERIDNMGYRIIDIHSFLLFGGTKIRKKSLLFFFLGSRFGHLS